ncbi:MAG: transposase, partial [Candidatus Aminicenantales bacterium]
TNRCKLYFMVMNKKFRAQVFIDFMRRLERQVGRRIYLIVDGHPVHRAQAVKRWLGKKGRRVRLFYLPG